MSVEELVEVFNTSDLLPYQIAEAVYNYLEPTIIGYVEYSEIKHLKNNSDLVAFYLAAQHLAE